MTCRKTSLFQTARKLLQNSLIALFILWSSSCFGSHLAGSEMNYIALGNFRYEITYSLYTDYPAGSPGNQAVLEIKSDACNRYQTELLALRNDLSEIIDADCPGTIGAPTYKKWVYRGIIQLPARCTDWKISASECCRSAAISTLQTPEQTSLYTEAVINNSMDDFSSAEFIGLPPFTLSAGQPNQLLLETTTNGADSITVLSVRPAISSTDDVTYLNGYDPLHPLRSTDSIQVNVSDKRLVFFPIQAETGVVALKAFSYHGGIITGSITREFRVSAVLQSNHLPTISGIDGGNDYSMTACAGSPVCFDLFTSDLDAGDHLQLLPSNVPADASVSITLGRTPSLHFCWTPPSTGTLNYTQQLLLRVNDDHCPMNGVQTYTITLHVRDIQFSATTASVSCLGNSDGAATVNAIGTTGPTSVFWTPSGLIGASVTGLPAGQQTVSIVDESGCTFDHNVVIVGQEGFTPVAVAIQDAICSTSGNGSIEVTLPHPSATYEIAWSPSGISSLRAEQLSPGFHTVTLRDRTTGCVINRRYELQAIHADPIINLGADRSSCQGRVIPLDAGIGFTSYRWNDGSTAQNFLATQTGHYSVEAIDLFGCRGVGEVNLEFAPCTAIDEPSINQSINIYPNPVQNSLHVNFMLPVTEATQVYVTDVLGKMLLTQQIEKNDPSTILWVGSLPPGVYLLYVSRSADASAFRFIKQ